MSALYSSDRKRTLSGWLKTNDSNTFTSNLKLQKFLFFYEAFSEVEGDKSEFDSLKGYQNGPVFSNVYGDVVHNRDVFSENVDKMYSENKSIISNDRANLSNFLVKIMNEEEISDLTHQFNIWKSKEERINNGEKQVPLSKEDFNSEDISMVNALKQMYPKEYVDSVSVLDLEKKSFVLNKDDLQKCTDDHLDAFLKLAENETLDNPVYVSFDENGVMILD